MTEDQNSTTDPAEPIKEEKKKGLFNKSCKECEKIKAECEQYKTGWQRALADYQNLQKEMSARRAEWAQMSEQQILEEFIPVYDNFKKAFASHVDVSSDSWAVGIQHIMKQFGDVLKAHGIEEIKTIGKKFDPKFHEAVGHEEISEKDSDEIVKEIDGGYKMGEKVIKAAKVIVSK